MKLLIDMNLSPLWVAFLAAHGVDAVHWSSVGVPSAPDVEIMAHARDHGLVVFTHDLDFGVLLALTRSAGPSVLQVRTQAVLPDDIGDLVLRVLNTFADALSKGRTRDCGSRRGSRSSTTRPLGLALCAVQLAFDPPSAGLANFTVRSAAAGDTLMRHAPACVHALPSVTMSHGARGSTLAPLCSGEHDPPPHRAS